MKLGVLKVDAVKVGAFEVDLMNPPSGKLTAKAAFINSKTGHTHGWTNHMVWSPATLLKLRELVESMELDLASAHFVEGGEASSTTGGGLFESSPQHSEPNSPRGLGEHLESSTKDADPID